MPFRDLLLKWLWIMDSKIIELVEWCFTCRNVNWARKWKSTNMPKKQASNVSFRFFLFITYGLGPRMKFYCMSIDSGKCIIVVPWILWLKSNERLFPLLNQMALECLQRWSKLIIFSCKTSPYIILGLIQFQFINKKLSVVLGLQTWDHFTQFIHQNTIAIQIQYKIPNETCSVIPCLKWFLLCISVYLI